MRETGGKHSIRQYGKNHVEQKARAAVATGSTPSLRPSFFYESREEITKQPPHHPVNFVG
jgi:hypothetical protein